MKPSRAWRLSRSSSMDGFLALLMGLLWGVAISCFVCDMKDTLVGDAVCLSWESISEMLRRMSFLVYLSAGGPSSAVRKQSTAEMHEQGW